MPKENKKRGRRADKKRKAEAEATRDNENESKRQKQDESGVQPEEPYVDPDQVYEEEQYQDEGQPERPFYGLLDEEEQGYFRKAGELLDADQFSSPEERDAFVESVYREAEGKELKLANSQSCSRLLEKIISISRPDQLKRLFKEFSGNLATLVQHRFASHCCEALFTQSALVVDSEQKARPKSSSSDDLLNMEEYFIQAAEELKPHLGWHLTDTHASHPLRVLLLILAGQPIAQSAGKAGIHSRRKENHTTSFDEQRNPILSQERSVPTSFHKALEDLIYTSVAGLDTTGLRSLASHKTGNPMLQLLLRLELTQYGKSRAKDETSIMHYLIPESAITSDSPSASFINGLLYDSIGSRLLETILEFAPSKTFKAIYKHFIKSKLATVARNDVATYVATKALYRLSKEDLEQAEAALVPEIPSLVERNRLVIIRTLIERCVERGAETESLATALDAAYSGPNGFDVARLLKLSIDGVSHPTNNAVSSNDKLHGSLLAQAMLASPGPLLDLILTSTSSLPPALIQTMSTDTHANRVLIAALSNPQSPTIARRKLISALYGHIGTIALNPAGSFVVDAIWTGATGLAFMRERVAEELAENEAALRDSVPGRKVWRNWRMDLYKRRRREWVDQSKSGAASSGFVGFPDESGEDGAGKVRGNENARRHMSALDKARERHARNKARREERQAGSAQQQQSTATATA